MLLLLGTVVLGGCATDRFRPSSGWSGVAVTEEQLYVGTMEGQVLALDAANGDVLWRFPPSDDSGDLEAIYGTPAVYEFQDEENNKKTWVLVGAFNKRIYALNAANGREQWQFTRSEGRIIGGPILVGVGE